MYQNCCVCITMNHVLSDPTCLATSVLLDLILCISKSNVINSHTFKTRKKALGTDYWQILWLSSQTQESLMWDIGKCETKPKRKVPAQKFVCCSCPKTLGDQLHFFCRGTSTACHKQTHEKHVTKNCSSSHCVTSIFLQDDSSANRRLFFFFCQFSIHTYLSVRVLDFHNNRRLVQTESQTPKFDVGGFTFWSQSWEFCKMFNLSGASELKGLKRWDLHQRSVLAN